jgi:L-2,4-diaminobutyrate decarboxylase
MQVKKFFVSKDINSQKQFRRITIQATEILEKFWWSNPKAYISKSPLKNFFIPAHGEHLSAILNDVGKNIISAGINPSNPKAIGHMHCLPTTSSIVTELLIGATNQSLDSWDESPGATYVEQSIVQALCKLIGLPAKSSGIVDSGGTMSNQTAVLIARDWYVNQELGVDIKKRGIPAKALKKLKVFCSTEAHFSIEKSVAICGLGTDAVVKVPVDKSLTIDENKLEQMIYREKKKGNLPFLIVATAGTTNAGNIPNLSKIAEIAHKNKAWFHVDAAYGGALVFSKNYKPLLKGIEKADSITLDPHKLLYQSVSCGLFLLRDQRHFEHLSFHSEYLNPKDDKTKGVINLVDRSMQTTRRFDALKLYVSLRNLGKDGYNALITSTIQTAQQFAELLKADPNFELATQPQTNIILLRFIKDGLNADQLNNINDKLQQQLYNSGKIIFSRTKIKNKVFLKATCMNPLTTLKDFREILKLTSQEATKLVSST